jgi:hypothetical protein
VPVSLVAGGLALVGAVTFAGSTSVQHHAAENAPHGLRGAFALVRHLVQQPLWLVGQVLAVAGLALHAAALHLGSVTVVQPIIISGVVLAVPIRSALSRRWPWPREMIAVCIAAVGLTAFLVASKPSGGRDAPLPEPAILVTAAGVALAVLAGLSSRLARHPTRRSFLLGVAAGALFGVVAGLMKAVLEVLTHDGLLATLASWTTWALVVLGCAAVITNQHAYRLARLSASMPVLNVVDGVVAIAFGYFAFREVPRHSPLFLAIEVLAFGAISVGLVVVARLEDEQVEGQEEAGSRHG